MLTLGLETSCDETGVALYHSENGLLGELLHSQAALHSSFGGVVPELAARDHSSRLLPLIQQLMQSVGLEPSALDNIAYTAGPGLAPALLVGATFGQALAQVLNIPCIGIHHMEGHLLAPLLQADAPAFPLLALLVSGGHSMLVDCRAPGRYRILGQSLDDAAGEAFDKTAKLLGLGYPGGAALAELAAQGTAKHHPLPMPMPHGLDFSFSGLKTSVRVLLQRLGDTNRQTRADIAASFQHSIVETLYNKCARALAQTGHRRLVIAGGVGANRCLRERIAELDCDLHIPPPAHCTDNGAMIALAGSMRLGIGQYDSGAEIHPRWSLETLAAI